MAQLTASAEESDIRWITVGQEPALEINGLAWFGENNGAYYRLPVREKENIPEGAWKTSKCPSGARVRFKTDSTQLKLNIHHSMNDKNRLSMWHMSSVGVSGIDLYRGEPNNMSFWLTTNPADGSKPYTHTYFTGKSKQMREFTLYLPTYAELVELKIGVDPNAVIEKPTEYKIKKPIVFYGTSITQGGCAGRGSNSFPAIIGRRLNADFVNLGFSGSGKGEELMAKLMTEIDASAYVVDCVANMNPELMKERYEKFITILRQTKPAVPVILMTRIYSSSEFEPDAMAHYNKQHEPLLATYEKFKKQGDKNIYLFDAGAIVKPNGDHPSVDGLHLTDRGFYLIADTLTPLLKTILYP